ncbi:MAG: bifunctional rhamnulose-1-phosphate aldolase/short-chain dehydrogenase [Flavisolibacter sp.]
MGADLRLTNYGGGNTSCKTIETDPLTGTSAKVMWVKGSGGDLGTLKRSGLSGLYLERLLNLRKIYKGITTEDEMVGLLNHCLFDMNSKAPSIDTPLHAFIPFDHIDHLHPDAAIAIAAAEEGEKITNQLFGGSIGWVNWQRPGFDLGLKLHFYLRDNPHLRGIMLGSHGLITWGDTAYESYINTLEIIERCAAYIEEAKGHKGKIFGEMVHAGPPQERKLQIASKLAPILRGFCSSQQKRVGHFTDHPVVMEFINSQHFSKLAPLGTSCPDHFLRTKISPLLIQLDFREFPMEIERIKNQLTTQFENYRNNYEAYYQRFKTVGTPPMRDPNPVVLLYPGIGMFTFAKDKAAARIAAEFYINAINVMKGAEAISCYRPLPANEAFQIEYWLLEEAKLKRLPPPKPLEGRVAFVTGSGGGIGKAIARKFIEEGACVVINDIDAGRLKKTQDEFLSAYGPDVFTAVFLDVTNTRSIQQAFQEAILYFGGIDLIVNCAGLSISKPIEEHTEQDWDILYDVLVKGQFLVTQCGLETMRRQGFGGDIINIVSKNALVSGPNNAAYGSAKAAQLHLSHLNAAELGKDKIRVNVINPDAVISDSKIWQSGWAEGRAKAYGVSLEELPGYYASRTLLNEIIMPLDIANACFVLVSGLLNKSTGNVINVDGGIANAFVR